VQVQAHDLGGAPGQEQRQAAGAGAQVQHARSGQRRQAFERPEQLSGVLRRDQAVAIAGARRVDLVKNLSLNLSRGVADGTAVGYRAGLEISSKVVQHLNREDRQGDATFFGCLPLRPLCVLRALCDLEISQAARRISSTACGFSSDDVSPSGWPR